MTRLVRRLRASLYERARYFVKQCDTSRLQQELGIPDPWQDSYELLETLASVSSLLETVPPILVDVGAHKGAFARAADKVLDFQRIVCVEPDADLIGELSRNVPSGKTSIHQVALAEAEGSAELFVHADRSMNSLVVADQEVLRTKFPNDRHDAVTSREVRTTTLDSLLIEAGILDGRNVFLKLDTQGNELNILHAAENTLRCTAACLIEFMFCTPYRTTATFRDLLQFLVENGLECRGALNIQRRPSYAVSAVDFFFVRRDGIPGDPSVERSRTEET